MNNESRVNKYTVVIGKVYFASMALCVTFYALYEFSVLSADFRNSLIMTTLVVFLLADIFLGIYFKEMKSGPIHFSYEKNKWKFMLRILLSFIMLILVLLTLLKAS